MSGAGRGPLQVEALCVPAFRGDLLTVVLPHPVPPGSRVEVLLPAGEGAVSGKIVAVRRGSDSAVEVDVRLGSLGRERRERIAALVSQPL